MAAPVVVIAITSGTRWRVPVDCTSATIEVIGGGSVGGGAYSKTNTVSLTPLSLAYINIGAGGGNPAGDTWFNKATNAAPSSTTNGALAKGAIGFPPSCGGVQTAYGGLASDGVGDLKYSGGAGLASLTCSGFTVYSFGGAAGPNGAGGNGYQSTSPTYGGGGGANGGASATGRDGGNNRLGTGGGTGGASPTAGTNGGGGGGNSSSVVGGAGSADLVWTDYLGNQYGPAGGNGAPSANPPFIGNAGVKYGGGGGQASSTGGQGLIIITYTPAVTIGNSYTEVLNTNGPTDVSTPSRWRIPYGVETVTIHAIGSGSVGSASNFNGGGGGAYATSAVDVSTLNNTGAYYLNYFTSSGLGLFGGSDAWFNKSSSSAPTSTTDGALAKGATYAGSTGGQASSSVGTTKYSGGNGGNGGGTTINKGGGGGGSAGPSGAGKNGGNVFSVTNASGSGGGGGGSNGGSSTAGGNSTAAATAGAGGAGTSGSGGGAAGTTTTNAGNGSNGGGGGGGKNTTGRTNGGNGAMQAIWTDSGTSVQYGPSGGGGGNAALTATNYGNPGVPSYGGGCGAYISSLGVSYAGQPILVLQYTITKAVPTIYDVSISESASGAETTSSALSNTVYGSIEESASGADTPSNIKAKTIVITSGTLWTVPADCTSATVECIGPGGRGGGSYARTNNVTLTPRSNVYINVGGPSYGSSTWFNKTANTAPTAGQTDRGALAVGSGGSSGCGTFNIVGGLAANSVGDVKYDGGGARFGYSYCAFSESSTSIFYSYGGAAGPQGPGGSGLQSGTTFGGGGGANGGGAGTSTSGGNNSFGTGGGANNGGTGSNGGGGGPNGAIGTGLGSYDPVWIDSYSLLSYGPSSGSGGSASYSTACSGAGVGSVTRGAGGGAFGGSLGIIVVTYVPATITPGTYTETFPVKALFSGTQSVWYTPFAAQNVKIEIIGNGNYGPARGGVYVSSTLAPARLYLSYIDPRYGDLYASTTGFTLPTSPSEGAYAASNGLSSSSVGTTKYSGGAPGANTYDSVYDSYLLGGGGGAAGPDGPGSDGGAGYSGYIANTPSGAGGGGSASGAGQSTGSAGTLTAGGAGGSITGGTGGTGGTAASKNGTAGTNGGGGGGAFYSNVTGSGTGGLGSQRNVWTDSFNGLIYGPWGGTGGIKADFSYDSTVRGGGGSSGNNGTWGVIVLTYTIPQNNSTITEASSAADSVSAGFLYSASIAESASGVDAITSTVTFSLSVSELASALDSINGGLSFSSSILESAAGADVADSVASFVGTIAETAAGLDVVSGNVFFSVAVTETASGVEAVSATATFSLDIAETAAGLDSISSTGTFDISVSESASGVDNVSSVATIAASIAETAAGADLAVANILFTLTVSESASGADASTSALAYTAIINEIASGLDALGINGTFNIAVVESAAGQDSISNIGSFGIAVVEAATGAEVMTARLAWEPIDDSQTPNWNTISPAQTPGWTSIDDTQNPGWTPT